MGWRIAAFENEQADCIRVEAHANCAEGCIGDRVEGLGQRNSGGGESQPGEARRITHETVDCEEGRPPAGYVRR